MSISIKRSGRVVEVHLNRPEVLNALNSEIMLEMSKQLKPLDRDPGIGCFVICGNDKAFAAGADIKEMADRSYMDMFLDDYFAAWEDFTALRTPKIAAVAGYALGGGCELAMMCDLVFAGPNARFGQPEIKLGVIPGIGGSQRLTKLVGKARAMDMVLTGRMMDAREAEQAGLVSRVIPDDQLIPQTMEAAKIIANHSKPAVMVAKEAVDRALELGLREGILFERRCFHALFSTEDQKEGMQAFINKRSPVFKGR